MSEKCQHEYYIPNTIEGDKTCIQCTTAQLRTQLAEARELCVHNEDVYKAQLKAAKEDAKHDLKMAKRIIERKEKFADKALNLSKILAVENNNLKKANTKLKEALEMYGKHTKECMALSMPGHTCDCGLEQALKGEPNG